MIAGRDGDQSSHCADLVDFKLLEADLIVEEINRGTYQIEVLCTLNPCVISTGTVA